MDRTREDERVVLTSFHRKYYEMKDKNIKKHKTLKQKTGIDVSKEHKILKPEIIKNTKKEI